MNFFRAQQQSRKRTLTLVVGYVLVLCLSLWLFYFFALWAVVVFRYLQNSIGDYFDIHARFEPRAYPGLWSPGVFFFTSVIGLGAMFAASLYRLRQLSRGGWVVAEMLGGTLVHPRTQDAGEKRLLNVVEEIAIASGTQVPVVYLLKGEIGLNSFAAGFSQDDAAIGVTQGCLNILSRDELQAVISHEFCHILSGDTRLKTLLAGLLFGVNAPVYFCGRRFMQMIQGRGGYCTPALLWLVLVMFSLVTVPFLLILQAVSMLAAALKRKLSVQREFHADARAVEFCRNPQALAGALKKIGGYIPGSRILVDGGDQASHFFFANPYGRCILGWSWLQSHPTLLRRICMIEPEFNGDYRFVSSVNGSAPPEHLYRSSAGQKLAAEKQPAPVWETSLGEGRNPLAVTAAILAAIPDDVQVAARDVETARFVVFALLLSDEPEVCERQVDRLYVAYSERDVSCMRGVVALISHLPPEQKLPLAKLAVRTLKAMSPADYPRFRQQVEDLIREDGRISPFEAALSHTILEHLAPGFEHEHSHRSSPGVAEIHGACRTLLSCLAYWGTSDMLEEENAYRAAMAHWSLTGDIPPILPRRACEDNAFDTALRLIARAGPDWHSRLLDACRICVQSDGRVTTTETQLLLTIADALNCTEKPIAA